MNFPNAKNTLLLLCTLLTLSIANTHAAVIYDETVDGDAPSTGGATVFADLGVLSIGDSIVNAFHDGVDFDDFRFEIASGNELLDIVFEIDIDTTGFGASLYDATNTTVAGQMTFGTGWSSTANTPISPFSNGMPLADGVYRIDNHVTVGTGNYSYTFKVREVPAPTSLTLMFCGLALLLLRKKRK